MVQPLHLGMAVLAVLCAAVPPAAAQDAGAGAKVFKTQCSVCHSVEAGKKGIGPNLLGVVGRKAGSVPDYQYSAANKNSGLTWDETTLDKYLAAPQTVVPGTKMTYLGLKNDAQRADVIAYLASQK